MHEDFVKARTRVSARLNNEFVVMRYWFKFFIIN
jgi:hypothetical protein